MRVNRAPLLPLDFGSEPYRRMVQMVLTEHARALYQVVDEPIFLTCSDEATLLTTGTKVTFRMPYPFGISAVRASLSTAQTTGSIFTVDVKNAGVSIFSTLLTIDNTEKTSITAATPCAIVSGTVFDDAEITVDITQVGVGAKGLKVVLTGHKE